MPRYVVVDAQTEDDTEQVAARWGACTRVHGGRLGALREFGRRWAEADWLICLDADERLAAGGFAEIFCAIASAPPDVAGFRLPILSHLGGKPLRWGGHFPAARIRVVRREAVRWDTRDAVHERARSPGRFPLVATTLLHFGYRDQAHAREKLRRYAAMQADSDAERRMLVSTGPPGWKAWWLARGAVRATWRFLRVLGLRGGALDGRAGFALAALNAECVWLRHWCAVRGAAARRVSKDPSIAGVPTGELPEELASIPATAPEGVGNPSGGSGVKPTARGA